MYTLTIPYIQEIPRSFRQGKLYVYTTFMCLVPARVMFVTQNLVSCVQQQGQVEDGEPETIVIKEDLNDQWERNQTQAIVVQDGE